MRTVLILAMGAFMVGAVAAGYLVAGLDHPAARATAVVMLSVSTIVLGMALEHLYPTRRTL